MNRLYKAVLLLATIALLSHCQDLMRPFEDLTKVDPCDPTGSVYQSSSHYFERDFLKSDGSLDYQKLVRLNRPRASPCDPLYNPDLVHTAPE